MYGERRMPRETYLGLESLFSDIHSCRLCPRVVPGRVPRVTLSIWNAELVLMAQAPSEHGVRISGVHWVDSQGRLRAPGGTYLESYLRRVGYSINPDEPRLPRPYTTNVLQCWPGRGIKRDRLPSSTELTNCSRWWQAEFKLLRPRAVLLLGKPAADGFMAACRPQASFTMLLESQGLVTEYLGGTISVFTVPHPTAPYKGQRGGRGEHYELAFSALGSFLAPKAAGRGP